MTDRKHDKDYDIGDIVKIDWLSYGICFGIITNVLSTEDTSVWKYRFRFIMDDRINPMIDRIMHPQQARTLSVWHMVPMSTEEEVLIKMMTYSKKPNE